MCSTCYQTSSLTRSLPKLMAIDVIYCYKCIIKVVLGIDPCKCDVTQITTYHFNKW